MSLINKVAIVTGASSGIGAAIALKFTEEGARVTIVGRNVEKLNNVAATCEQRGSKPLSIIADVTKNEDAERIINETVNFFGKIDILINNAGIATGSRLQDDKAMEVFDNVMLTNLRSAVYMSHLAIKHLIKTKGNIVNISSVAAKMPIGNTSFSYCTSKAALDHFTKCCAFELAEHGIRVNAINPGPVKTDIVENAGIVPKGASDSFWEMAKNTTLLKRCADPVEIADLATFVVSDKGKSFTGATLLTDNGAVFLRPTLRN